MFRKFVCIYLIVYSSIGSNGPFPLPKYCALPIASLDLIICIYCFKHSLALKILGDFSFMVFLPNKTVLHTLSKIQFFSF